MSNIKSINQTGGIIAEEVNTSDDYIGYAPNITPKQMISELKKRKHIVFTFEQWHEMRNRLDVFLNNIDIYSHQKINEILNDYEVLP